MGKLGEFVSKGVRLIVADTGEGAEKPKAPPDPAKREIPAEAFEEPAPKRIALSEVPTDVADFAAVYKEAGIELPAHGYGIDRVAEMLENKRLATLAREVKASAVLAALETAGVPIREVIQDAVRRDRALDQFEAAKQREVGELRAASETRIQETQKEIEEFLKKKNAEIADLKQAAEAAARAFADLQARKRKEEERLHEVVAHFIEGADNPITTERSPGPAPKPGPA